MERPWGLLLLVGASLLIGALFQDPVRYGWLAGVASALLLVRMAAPLESAEEEPSLWEYRPGEGMHLFRAALTVLAHLVLLAAITYLIADAIELTRGAASAGNEALWIATAWGLYGLLLVLTAPLVSSKLPWHQVGQASFGLALSFLVLGGLMANGRWADAPVRYAAYSGILGSVWLAAWVRGRTGRLTASDRLLALAAVVVGFGVLSFETLRWLEPRFTYQDRTAATLEALTRDHNLQTGISLAAWALYSLLVLGIGVRLRSRPVRFLGGALASAAGLYGLFWLIL